MVVIARKWREPGATIRGLFGAASPELSDKPTFERVVTERLRKDQELINAWQMYSEDKRSSPSPYRDGLEVGFLDRELFDVTEHVDSASACADFLYREACWVLLHARVDGSGSHHTD